MSTLFMKKTQNCSRKDSNEPAFHQLKNNFTRKIIFSTSIISLHTANIYHDRRKIRKYALLNVRWMNVEFFFSQVNKNKLTKRMLCWVENFVCRWSRDCVNHYSANSSTSRKRNVSVMAKFYESWIKFISMSNQFHRSSNAKVLTGEIYIRTMTNSMKCICKYTRPCINLDLISYT